ncbi:MAG TPA: cytochrome c oxidase subunit II [Kofleriaceae bacterium]|nr:cytochrome c oxidase subunit II [Kofleriaceae bacterium]
MSELLRRILMLPEQSSTVAADIDRLHYFVIVVTMLGAAGVAATTLWFLIRYREGGPLSRRSRGKTGEEIRPARTRAALIAELTAVGGLLSLFVLWWVIGFRQFVGLHSPPEDSLEVYVTAKQWMWSFAYPNGTGSNGVLYVPVGQPVELIMTSRDVVHSFYVPEFRIKQDVVPGRSSTVWFEVVRPGRYQVFCAEYCGISHSTMRAQVIALDGEDYARALEGLSAIQLAGPTADRPAVVGEQAPAEPLSLAAIGQRVAAQAGCLRCHTVDGTAHTGPTWAGLYGATIPLEGGQVAVASEAYLTESMMDPRAKVHLGFKPVMPSYQGIIDAPQIGALVHYIRSLRDVRRSGGPEPAPAAVEGSVPLVQPLTGEPGEPPAPPPASPPASGTAPPAEATP